MSGSSAPDSTAPTESAHRGVFRVRYDDPEDAAAVAAAVAVEEDDIDDDRSRARVDRTAATVRVVVEARDLVGLRAGLNTWSRLVETAESTVDAARA